MFSKEARLKEGYYWMRHSEGVTMVKLCGVYIDYFFGNERDYSIDEIDEDYENIEFAEVNNGH